MTLDALLVIIVLAFTLVSYYTGILRQVLKVACLLVSFFLSGPTAKFLCAHFATEEHIGPISSYGMVRIGSWLGLYIILRILAFYINRAVGADRSGVFRLINRRLGAYLGFLEGVGLALVVLWSLQVWISDEETVIFPAWRDKAVKTYASTWSQNSVFWRLASRYNPLIGNDCVPNLKILLKIARHPEVVQSLQQNAKVKQLLNHPKVKAVMQDEALRKDLTDRNYIKALNNANFKAMISDPEVQALTRNVHVFDVLKEELSRIESASPQKKKAHGAGRKS